LTEIVKADIALHEGSPPQSYGTSLTIWDHTVLPATRHKCKCSAYPQPDRPYQDVCSQVAHSR